MRLRLSQHRPAPRCAAAAPPAPRTQVDLRPGVAFDTISHLKADRAPCSDFKTRALRNPPVPAPTHPCAPLPALDRRLRICRPQRWRRRQRPCGSALPAAAAARRAARCRSVEPFPAPCCSVAQPVYRQQELESES